MSHESSVKITLSNVDDIVSMRRSARDFAKRMGFGLADQTRLATAVSELARNVIQYAGSGSGEMNDLSTLARLIMRVQISDQGPGIEDIDQAMLEGYTSGNGLGAGLPGCERLSDHFLIESEPGVGTCVVMEIHADR